MGGPGPSSFIDFSSSGGGSIQCLEENCNDGCNSNALLPQLPAAATATHRESVTLRQSNLIDSFAFSDSGTNSSSDQDWQCNFCYAPNPDLFLTCDACKTVKGEDRPPTPPQHQPLPPIPPLPQVF